MNEILEETILEKQLLHGKIKQFYNYLLDESTKLGDKSCEGIEAKYWLRKYKEHFNSLIKL